MSSRERNKQVYIRGFSKKTDKSDIKYAFRKYGKIEDIQIFKQSYAFVTYYDYRDAEDAVKGMNRRYLTKYDDYKLTVEHSGGGQRRRQYDQPREAQPYDNPNKGPQKDDKCFHCQQTGHWKNQCPVYFEQRQKYQSYAARRSYSRYSSRSSSRNRYSSRRRSSRRKRSYSSSSSRSNSSDSYSRSRSRSERRKSHKKRDKKSKKRYSSSSSRSSSSSDSKDRRSKSNDKSQSRSRSVEKKQISKSNSKSKTRSRSNDKKSPSNNKQKDQNSQIQHNFIPPICENSDKKRSKSQENSN